jgi:hypothetical protein
MSPHGSEGGFEGSGYGRDLVVTLTRRTVDTALTLFYIA